MFSDREMKALARLKNTCTRWGQHDRYLKVHVKGEDAELETAAWSGHIVLYGRGDLNGDGIEDLLFMREAVEAGGGAMPDISEQLFILTQTAKDPCPRIVWALPDFGG